jgi:hypothetical protein
VLILSGNDDLRTPYAQDQQVAAGYSQVQLVRVAGAGHSTVSTDQSGCAERAMVEFFSAGSAAPSCPVRERPPLPPLPVSLSAVHPARGTSGLSGKAAAAVAATLEDLFAHPSGGGLRGGFSRVGGSGIELKNLVDVPGVSVDGSIRFGRRLFTGQLTVRGQVSGTLTLHGRALRGRVDGSTVQVELTPVF